MIFNELEINGVPVVSIKCGQQTGDEIFITADGNRWTKPANTSELQESLGVTGVVGGKIRKRGPR